MLKIASLVVVIAGFTYVGWGLARFYSRRLRYFKDCILLSERLYASIAFSHEKLNQIVESNRLSFGKDMQKTLLMYQGYLTHKIEKLEKQGMNILRENETETILLFLQSLGRLDVKNQTEEIDNFKKRFEEMKLSAEEDNKKKGGLYLKLGLILGILVAILLI